MEPNLNQERQQAHALLDMLPAEKLNAVRSLLEVMGPGRKTGQPDLITICGRQYGGRRAWPYCLDFSDSGGLVG